MSLVNTMRRKHRPQNPVAELLDFPRLSYENTFKQDYKKADASHKVNLQKILARVSCLLEESKGDLVVLKKHGGLQYSDLHQRVDGKTIGHFRITQSEEYR